MLRVRLGTLFTFLLRVAYRRDDVFCSRLNLSQLAAALKTPLLLLRRLVVNQLTHLLHGILDHQLARLAANVLYVVVDRSGLDPLLGTNLGECGDGEEGEHGRAVRDPTAGSPGGLDT